MNLNFFNLTSTRLTTLAVTLLLSANMAQAQEEPGEYVDEAHGIAGLGVGTIPKFMGSDKTKADVTPIVKITYGRFFLGGSAGPGIGYNAFESGNFSFGTYLSHPITNPRKESDDIRLSGLGDVKATTRAGFFSNYSYDWLRAGADISWDIGGKKQGMLAKFSAEAVFHPMEKFELAIGPRITYGSSEYVNTLFGVNQSQSTSSGLPIYTPKSGITQAAMGFEASYILSKDWLIGSRLIIGRLEGDSAKSPFVEKKTQNTFGAFAAYRF